MIILKLNRAVPLCALSMALGFHLVAPRSSAQNSLPQRIAPGGVAPGEILIDISGHGMHEDYRWHYQIQPLSGSVRLLKEDKVQHDSAVQAAQTLPPAFQEWSGNIQGCGKDPTAMSPNGRSVARCQGSRKADHSPGDDLLLVAGTASGASSFQWKRKGRSIRGFAWSPNSESVAILNVSERYGKDPLGVLSGLAGHPIPHSSVFLDIMDVRAGGVTEYLVRKNVVYVYPRILGWSE